MRLMRCLYVGIGDEPVGRPSTNGFSGVGLKSFILKASGESISFRQSARGLAEPNVRTYGHIPLRDVVSDVLSNGLGIVADDETWRRVNTDV